MSNESVRLLVTDYKVSFVKFSDNIIDSDGFDDLSDVK